MSSLLNTYTVLILLCLVGVVSSPLEVHMHRAGEACFEDIDCFKPFEADPDVEIGSSFILHTNPEPDVGRKMNASRSSILEAGFNQTLKTKVIIRDYAPMADGIADFVPRMTSAILAKEDANVIVVDWVNGAYLEYDQSARNTRVVGALTAHLLRNIASFYDYDPKMIHVIGSSLGAHVAGFTGKEIFKHREDHQKIGRLTETSATPISIRME